MLAYNIPISFFLQIRMDHIPPTHTWASPMVKAWAASRTG